jgi:glyoxylase-like metal-dependent hydrolase (beta-lactamase superfamily II)
MAMRTIRRLFSVPLLLIGAASFAQTAPPAAAPLPFQLKMVAPNVWAAIDDAKGDAGANAGFVIGDGGVAVIDSFENEAAARALLGEIRKLTQQPVKFVVNTHYHLDHVAGNKVFAQAGAVIVGHHNIRSWIHTENLKFFGEKIKPEEKTMVENLLAPEVTYDSAVTLFLGSRRVEVKFFDGHTGGDSVAFVPDAGVVFCGDLFWRKTLPNLIDASASAWIHTLSELATLPDDAVPGEAKPMAATFVPGHGEVGTASDVREFQDYLKNLRAMVQRPEASGKTGDELVAAVMPELTRSYGAWDFFKYFSRSNILDMGAELRDTKRLPPREKQK